MILDSYHNRMDALYELALEVQELREHLATARADTLREVREKVEEAPSATLITRKYGLKVTFDAIWRKEVLAILDAAGRGAR